MDLFEMENDKSLLSNILSRRSSVGCSSRISYYRSGEGVPFKWEMQPGIAKDQSPKQDLPPLTPPPAIISMGLPKPCIIADPEPFSTKSKLWFWKKRVKQGKNNNKSGDCIHDEDVASFDCSSNDSESMASPRGSSFSSSSSLSLMKSHSSMRSTCSESTPTPTKRVYGKTLNLGCFPVLVSIARRD